MDFKEWPKTPRLNRDITITEKIDGTNAAVIISDEGAVSAQSRSRLITPGKSTDNYGFAGWVEKNANTLLTDLGPGYHYGEWWGAGIQRGYGCSPGVKVFSLFNSFRWKDAEFYTPGLDVVPVLYSGPFSQDAIESAVQELRDGGSRANLGFMRPEGVIEIGRAHV